MDCFCLSFHLRIYDAPLVCTRAKRVSLEPVVRNACLFVPRRTFLSRSVKANDSREILISELSVGIKLVCERNEVRQSGVEGGNP